MPPFLRTAVASDIDALYDICVRTADGGRTPAASSTTTGCGATCSRCRTSGSSPTIRTSWTTAPVRPSATSWAPRTPRAFARLLRDVWLPATAGRVPVPPDPPVTAQDGLRALHHHPEWRVNPELAAYPAHLHIDLLPDWQGRGFGRGLMAALIDGLRAAGVPALHLEMLTSNTNARRFYDRLGFTELPMSGPGDLTILVRDTSPLD